MNAQNTPGLLKLHTKYPQDMVTPDGHYTVARTLPQPTIAVAVANARRLMACWNACDGLRTESLERMGTLDRATIAHEVELQSRIKQAEFQRDELLEVLKRLESANEHRAHLMSGDNYIQQLRIRGMGDALTEIDLARHAARAAIAKAEGGAA